MIQFRSITEEHRETLIVAASSETSPARDFLIGKLANETGVSARTIEEWVGEYRDHQEQFGDWPELGIDRQTLQIKLGKLCETHRKRIEERENRDEQQTLNNVLATVLAGVTDLCSSHDSLREVLTVIAKGQDSTMTQMSELRDMVRELKAENKSLNDLITIGLDEIRAAVVTEPEEPEKETFDIP